MFWQCHTGKSLWKRWLYFVPRRRLPARHVGQQKSFQLHLSRGLSSRIDGRIGFVGLGNMGSCMATNLIAAGQDVLVYDVDPSRKSAMSSKGARVAQSLEEIATTSSSIITMLPDTPQAETAYLGSGESIHKINQEQSGQGLLEWARPGTLLIDSSTIDPSAARRISRAAAKKGNVMIDAPVSGGVPAATDGTLTFMAGGTVEGLAKARPLLEAMGSKTVHCGEAGAGCVAKVCNNLCLAISMVGVSEAMGLGTKMGMHPKVLANVLNSSTARCWSSASYNPHPTVIDGVPSSRQYEGGFATSLMVKDLRLALQAALESSQSVPMGTTAHSLYSTLCSKGYGGKDFSSIYKMISEEGDDEAQTAIRYPKRDL